MGAGPDLRRRLKTLLPWPTLLVGIVAGEEANQPVSQDHGHRSDDKALGAVTKNTADYPQEKQKAHPGALIMQLLAHATPSLADSEVKNHA